MTGVEVPDDPTHADHRRMLEIAIRNVARAEGVHLCALVFELWRWEMVESAAEDWCPNCVKLRREREAMRLELMVATDGHDGG